MGDVVRRRISNDEAAKIGLDGGTVTRKKLSNDEFAALGGAPGEAGNPGPDPYAGGPNAHVPTEPTEPTLPWGTPWDGVKSLANTAAVGTGPQIAGVIGAGLARPDQEGDAYESVRNDTAKDLAKSADTKLGKIGSIVGAFLTPGLPKPVAGAAPSARAWQGAAVAGTLGAVHGAATSKGDITKLDSDNVARIIIDALKEGVPAAGVGAGTSALMSVAQRPLREAAEEQALRAAGLEAGIKNSVRKDLGASNMDEARRIGRSFLDEKLIPPVGSSEAVAKRAGALRGTSGSGIGRVLTAAELSGVKANEADAADAARRVLDQSSAVADEMSGAKARQLADSVESQGRRTPGSFLGLNEAKSDAWKSANFDADAKMSPVLYRKAVGAVRDDIERQVGGALGPDAAAELAGHNAKFSTASDALRLADAASGRAAARKGFTTGDLLALLAPASAGGAAGHPLIGGGTGLAAVLGKKAFERYGHSSAARFSDFLAKRTMSPRAPAVAERGADALAKYMGLLEEDKP